MVSSVSVMLNWLLFPGTTDFQNNFPTEGTVYFTGLGFQASNKATLPVRLQSFLLIHNLG